MSKDGFNDVSKGVDDKVSFSTNDMELGARALCKAMARHEGTNSGNIASQAIWKMAEEYFHPSTIHSILNREGIDWDIGQP